MNSVLITVLCALCIGHISAQRCREEDQVRAEESVNLADFVELLDVQFPESCGDFVPLSLLPCRDELDVVSGCCMSECRDLFVEYSPQCLLELTEILCESDATAAAVPILNRVASRCDADYDAPLVCEEEISSADMSNAAIGSLPELDSDDLEDSDGAIAELENLPDAAGPN